MDRTKTIKCLTGKWAGEMCTMSSCGTTTLVSMDISHGFKGHFIQVHVQFGLGAFHFFCTCALMGPNKNCQNCQNCMNVCKILPRPAVPSPHERWILDAVQDRCQENTFSFKGCSARIAVQEKKSWIQHFSQLNRRQSGKIGHLHPRAVLEP